MAKGSLTEQDSHYDNLELMNVAEIIRHINDEDKKVPAAIQKSLPQIERLITKLISILKTGGRLFYIGAGTSGRLGVLDASECVVTFGIPQGVIIGIIAGGDKALRVSIEGAEDSPTHGFEDLEAYDVSPKDMVVGIAASGRTPYVIHAIKACKEKGILTGCIVCNPESELAKLVDFPVEVLVGPEFVTGSTRMKSGTAQKLVLNMVTTAAMIRLGKIEGNKMTHMSISNSKLADRGIRIIAEKTGLPSDESKALLERNGNNIARALRDFRKRK